MIQTDISDEDLEKLLDRSDLMAMAAGEANQLGRLERRDPAADDEQDPRHQGRLSCRSCRGVGVPERAKLSKCQWSCEGW